MTLRIDLGRVFPGAIVLLVGVALFVFWLLLVFISFFAFFAPPLRDIFYVALYILVASIVLMASGGLLVLAGFSGWRRTGWGGTLPGSSMSGRWDEDRLSPGQRAGEVFGVFISFLVLLFFVENQLQQTGFFTSRFGSTEQALFYGTWALGAAVSVGRAVYGRRNAVRPFDALYGMLLMITAVELLMVFPFDFGHLPDLLPSSLRFAFAWVSNPIAAVAFVLAALGGLASMVYNAVVFAVVRSGLQRGGTPRKP